MNNKSFEYLDKITFPEDLRSFRKKDLKNICEDLREDGYF